MRKYLFGTLLISILASCGGSGSSGPAPAANLAGFITESIAGSDAELAIKKDATGGISESGVIRGGVKDGVYITYYPEGRIKTLSNYVNGKLNGVHLELSEREQVEAKSYYLNDVLHGQTAKYKYGRATQELNYKNGVLDGAFTEWSDRGKLSKKGFFKNGKQDGLLQFFDEEEKLMMEYTYKDGEKVSGGIVEEK